MRTWLDAIQAARMHWKRYLETSVDSYFKVPISTSSDNSVEYNM